MSVFRFKQFAVKQTDSAMKVGTDSVLLGSLLNAATPRRILDIGTGTGLLAMMMAQRFPGITIDAVELNKLAYEEAVYNFRQSKWPERLNAHHKSIQEYAAETNHAYDLIVSNPPYYEIEKNYGIGSANRSHARHTGSLSFDELLKNILELLTDDGLCWMILPSSEAGRFITKATESRFYCVHRTEIFPSPMKSSNRLIFCLTKKAAETTRDHFYIKDKTGNYTESYKEVTMPFLLWESS